ncbi:MAG TPA: shikimate dehydrogenase [Terriglobales bacterium]|nr:shikimate dehydrogenase [Terriglobales bacterium]
MNARVQSYDKRIQLRLPRLCVPVIGDSPAEMFRKAEEVVKSNSFIELRLDYLRTPAQALPPLKRFLDYHPQVTAIATCRRVPGGGKFRGSVASEVDLLTKAASAGCQIIDVEIETAEAMKPAEYERLRSRATVVLSFHDFKGTRKLQETFSKMQAYPADFYKVVSTATRLYDNVVMMRFLQEQRDRHSMVGLCMGEQGLISRVLALRAGSSFTFASSGLGEETAPGQITARELRDIYRIDNLDAATRIYGVAGDPVAHSLSPVMMNSAFRRENVNAIYLGLHVKAISDLLECVNDIPVHGLSITMPYKEEIVPHLDNSDTLTRKSGACNTVVRMQGGQIYGFNTDVAGVIGALEAKTSLDSVKILVLGAGGAARSAVFGLKEKGAEVYILNRTPAPAQKLARQAHAKVVKRTDLKKLVFDIIINATPIGMDSKASPLELNEINARFLLDMVYQVGETRLMKLARSKGIEVIPGTEMFVHQGARQFEIWTGKPAPVAEMRHAVVSTLERRTAQSSTAK